MGPHLIILNCRTAWNHLKTCHSWLVPWLRRCDMGIIMECSPERRAQELSVCNLCCWNSAVFSAWRQRDCGAEVFGIHGTASDCRSQASNNLSLLVSHTVAPWNVPPSLPLVPLFAFNVCRVPPPWVSPRALAPSSLYSSVLWEPLRKSFTVVLYSTGASYQPALAAALQFYPSSGLNKGLQSIIETSTQRQWNIPHPDR